MKIQVFQRVKNENLDAVKFVIDGTSVELVNAFRRLILTEVPTMAITEVLFVENDTVLFDELIAPSQVKGSPVYVAKRDFRKLFERVHENAFQSWILVKDKSGKYAGFANSLLVIEEGELIPVIYGPYLVEGAASLENAILSKMLSFWKDREMSPVKILRSDDLSEITVKDLNLDLKFRLNQYIFKK